MLIETHTALVLFYALLVQARLIHASTKELIFNRNVYFFMNHNDIYIYEFERPKNNINVNDVYQYKPA